MRHRASRPFFDLWRRLPRATARPLGALSQLTPVRAVLALVVMLGLGTGAVAAVAAVTGGLDDSPGASAALGPRPGAATSRSGERPSLTEAPSTPARPGNGGATPSSRPTDTQSRVDRTPAASDVPSPLSSAASQVGQATRSATVPTPATSAHSRPSVRTPTTTTDRTPPSTSVSASYPEGDTAVFSFAANEAASFTCSLDGAAYTSCASPESYSGLEPGWHTFAVRARDTSGNVDPSPAQVRWHANAGPSAAD